MPRRERPAKGNRAETPTDPELSRPARRLEQCKKRIAHYVALAPVGINLEALDRYITTGELADREGIIGDLNNENQAGYLRIIDRELDIKATCEQEIHSGIEVLPPVDPNEEILDAKMTAAADSVIKLGADRKETYQFLALGEPGDAYSIWLQIQDRPGAEEAMRALIKTANELIHGVDKSPPEIIDIDDVFSVVKRSE